MEREAVESSAVTSLGYDDATLTLEVETTNGNVYQYQGVPPPVAEAMKAAGSIGQFYNQQIKGRYPFSRVE
jgi:hypothetical protein